MTNYLEQIQAAKTKARAVDSEMKDVHQAMFLVTQAQEAADASAKHLGESTGQILTARTRVDQAEASLTSSETEYQRMLQRYNLKQHSGKHSAEMDAALKKINKEAQKSQQSMVDISLQHLQYRDISRMTKEANLAMIRLEQKVKANPGDQELYEELQDSVKQQKEAKQAETDSNNKQAGVIEKLRKTRDLLAKAQLRANLVDAVQAGRIPRAQAKLVMLSHFKAVYAEEAAASAHSELNALLNTQHKIQAAVKQSYHALGPAVRNLQAMLSTKADAKAQYEKVVGEASGARDRAKELAFKAHAKQDKLHELIKARVSRRKKAQAKESAKKRLEQKKAMELQTENRAKYHKKKSIDEGYDFINMSGEEFQEYVKERQEKHADKSTQDADTLIETKESAAKQGAKDAMANDSKAKKGASKEANQKTLAKLEEENKMMAAKMESAAQEEKKKNAAKAKKQQQPPVQNNKVAKKQQPVQQPAVQTKGKKPVRSKKQQLTAQKTQPGLQKQQSAVQKKQPAVQKQQPAVQKKQPAVKLLKLQTAAKMKQPAVAKQKTNAAVSPAHSTNSAMNAMIHPKQAIQKQTQKATPKLP
jgi:hypothetical protein